MKESTQAITVPVDRYPIQIQRWKVDVNNKVKKDEVLGIYEYLETIEENQITKRAEIRVPYEGLIESLVTIGHICRSHEEALGYIKEDCSHSVQLHGLCALCGQDLSIPDYIGSDTHRVSINLAHDSKGVMISHKEAQRIESLTTERLLKQKKLSLLLDLDQTVVHATVDSTVKEWLENPNNPNFPALDEIHQFSLNESPTVYYLKLRPGTRKFLRKLHKKYEMHIYTMGTRAYAHEVSKILDPDEIYFKDRILSRDDSGSFMFKSIQRLFPCDQSMVVAIDDRADVWNWSDNLIKVRPYNYFQGIGDINEPLKENGIIETTESKKVRPRMQDNDNELEALLEALDTLHLKFYSQIDEKPQVAQILPTIKQRVLAGCRIVFSGVIPLGKDPIYNELWISAIKFGAIVQPDIDETSTHLIAAKVGTVKCNKAIEMKMWIVKPEWLIESISQWAKVLEKDYILDESFLDRGGYQVKANWDDMDNEVDDVLLDTSSDEENEKEGQDNVEDELVYQGSQGSRSTSHTDDDDWLALEIEAELNRPSNLGKRKHDAISDKKSN